MLDNYRYRHIQNMYRGADKSLARPGRKQARKHVREARDFNNIETLAAIKFPNPPPPQGKAPKEIHAIMTEALACFLPGRAKDLSTYCFSMSTMVTRTRPNVTFIRALPVFLKRSKQLQALVSRTVSKQRKNCAIPGRQPRTDRDDGRD